MQLGLGIARRLQGSRTREWDNTPQYETISTHARGIGGAALAVLFAPGVNYERSPSDRV